MKNKKFLLFTGAMSAAAFALYSVINNKYGKNKNTFFTSGLFDFCGYKNRLKYTSVWRSPYGDIAFTEAGEGAPLLLIHGIAIGGGAHEWYGNINEFAKSRKVYCIDLPGFGSSGKQNITYSSYYYAKVINDFIIYIINKKTDVIALHSSCGPLLAAAAFKPHLYRKIIAVNPFFKGHGEIYKDSKFVKTALALPVSGAFVYNFISSKQSILAFLETVSPINNKYEQIETLMQSRYVSAHTGGTKCKYAVLSFISGLIDTAEGKLLNSCAAERMVILSKNCNFYYDEEDATLFVKELNDGSLFPNIFSRDEFHKLAEDFLT